MTMKIEEIKQKKLKAFFYRQFPRFKCRGRMFARTSAASVDVDLKRRLKTRANGR